MKKEQALAVHAFTAYAFVHSLQIYRLRTWIKYILDIFSDISDSCATLAAGRNVRVVKAILLPAIVRRRLDY